MKLIEHAHHIADEDLIKDECAYLQNVFLKRTFACYDSKRSRAPRERDEEPIQGVAMVPFYQSMTNRLARILQCRKIRTVSYPLSKLRQHLCPVKDALGLKIPGVYQISCECRDSYIGQTGRLISSRITETSSSTRAS